MTDAQINIAKIVKFVQQHEEHAAGLGVLAALDVTPNVIRFDCQGFDCTEPLQIPYNPEHL